METSRREFFAVVGGAVVGLASIPLVKALASQPVKKVVRVDWMTYTGQDKSLRAQIAEDLAKTIAHRTDRQVMDALPDYAIVDHESAVEYVEERSAHRIETSVSVRRINALPPGERDGNLQQAARRTS